MNITEAVDKIEEFVEDGAEWGDALEQVYNDYIEGIRDGKHTDSTTE